MFPWHLTSCLKKIRKELTDETMVRIVDGLLAGHPDYMHQWVTDFDRFQWKMPILRRIEAEIDDARSRAEELREETRVLAENLGLDFENG
ncbi:MAG: hypothetical protein HGB18_03480 [Candidatus Moranbacteria bacterium]|nr:hypothetical protein [Candidatus Moranbacteria bacterium]